METYLSHDMVARSHDSLPAPCPTLIQTLSNGKLNCKGYLAQMGSIRAKEVSQCVHFAIVLYMFHRFEILGEKFLNLRIVAVDQGGKFNGAVTKIDTVCGYFCADSCASPVGPSSSLRDGKGSSFSSSVAVRRGPIEGESESRY